MPPANPVEEGERHQTLDIQRLLRQARTQSGLSDFGDERFLAPLARLLACAAQEVNFHSEGLQDFKREVLRDLMNRLRFHDDLKRHPEILDEDVSDPIVIIGLPRSGTTKTQRMIGTDPGLLNTAMWQVLNPAPFPNAMPGEPDPRILSISVGESLVGEDVREVHAAHHMAVDSLEEYWNLTEFTFNDWYQNCRNPLPSFSKWVLGRTDPPDIENYRYIRSLLQYLQWQQGGRGNKRWLLKGCGFLGCLGELFETLPNATVMHIHRHPAACVPSLAKLLKGVWALRIQDPDSAFIGQHLLEWEKTSMERYLETRERLKLDDRIIDVAYDQIRSDPMPVIRELYRRADRPLTGEAVRRMQQWEKDNELGKHGEHRYSLEEFGLSKQQIDAAFGDYIKRFVSP